jgi:hypothetical protein
MDQKKPEYFRPALIAGSVAGLLSGLPVISAGNCLCCLWIIGGAAMAVKLLIRTTPSVLASGDGAVVGALTGVVAAVVHTLLSVVFQPFNVDTAQRALDWLSGHGVEIPSNIDGMLQSGSGFLSPGWTILGLFFMAAMYAIVGVLGGIIGVSLFAKKSSPPAPPAPSAPLPPPPTSSGPTHAA